MIAMTDLSLYLMATLYALAGSFHFIRPRFYRRIIPPWVPWPVTCVYLSGAVEIILGMLLLIPDARVIAAWGILILLILIFPANIEMYLNYRRRRHPFTWIPALRLPLQGLLVWWAYQYTQ
jgi:uncharacterized membrane protein